MTSPWRDGRLTDSLIFILFYFFAYLLIGFISAVHTARIFIPYLHVSKFLFCPAAKLFNTKPVFTVFLRTYTSCVSSRIHL